MITSLLLLAALGAAPAPTAAKPAPAKPAPARAALPKVDPEAWDKAFPLTKVPTPAGVDDQVGGLAFLEDGRLAVSYRTARAPCW